MSITSMGSCSTSEAQSTQYRSAGAAASAPARPNGPPQGGAGEFVSAIASALSEIGVAASGEGEAGSATPAQALGQFLNTLMDTLKSQGGAQGRPPPPGAGGPMQADLQSLIEDLSDDSDAGADTQDSAGALEDAFATLLGALGVDSSDAGAKLGQFLQSLAEKLDASGPSGNLINTTA